MAQLVDGAGLVRHSAFQGRDSQVLVIHFNLLLIHDGVEPQELGELALPVVSDICQLSLKPGDGVVPLLDGLHVGLVLVNKGLS